MKSKWLPSLLMGLILLLTSSVIGCGESYTQEDLDAAYETGHTEGYDDGSHAGYKVGYDEGRASVFTAPEGSVLEYKGNYLAGEGGEGCWGYQITGKVQNLGADGIITVFAEITPQDVVDEGKNLRSTEVYLRQGQDMNLNFHFWVNWPNEGFRYVLWCVPSRFTK